VVESETLGHGTSLYERIEWKRAVTSKAKEYRRQAEEAEAKAKTTHDLSASRMYEELAQHYRYLAESAREGGRLDFAPAR
jgi:hypothetical protein